MKVDKEYKKNTVKVHPMPVVAVGIISCVLLDVAIVLFCILYPKEPLKIITWIIISVCAVILPITMVLFTARRVFSTISINKHGIKRTCFKVFYKLEMPWDGIREIRYCERIGPYLMISKTESIEKWTFENMIKRKDILQIALTPKVYKAIKPYLQQPILGLTEEKIKTLKLE